jgi:hypothetical protein
VQVSTLVALVAFSLPYLPLCKSGRMFVCSSVVIREGQHVVDDVGSLMQDPELVWDTGCQSYFFSKISRSKKNATNATNVTNPYAMRLSGVAL